MAARDPDQRPMRASSRCLTNCLTTETCPGGCGRTSGAGLCSAGRLRTSTHAPGMLDTEEVTGFETRRRRLPSPPRGVRAPLPRLPRAGPGAPTRWPAGHAAAPLRRGGIAEAIGMDPELLDRHPCAHGRVTGPLPPKRRWHANRRARRPVTAIQSPQPGRRTGRRALADCGGCVRCCSRLVSGILLGRTAAAGDEYDG